MDECLDIFNTSIALGPVYVCTCCLQTWFKTSVHNTKNIKFANKKEEEMFKKCQAGWTSVNNIEWICNSCRNAVSKLKPPKLSTYNKLGFPPRPPELELYPLEECLVAPRIPFMQFRQLRCGGQQSVIGNMVNVPNDIAPTVNTLPRHMNDTDTITIKFKRKRQYKRWELKENVRPLAVWKAANYLCKNSKLYKDIHIDTTWLDSLQNEQTECENETHESNVTSNETYKSHNMLESTTIENDSADELDEESRRLGIVHLDTMLDDHQLQNRDVDMQQNDDIPNEMTFAPGEGQTPISVFQDENAEYLAFPSIFCGQTCPTNTEREIPVHYSDICKYELCCVDRRAASNVANLFFKLKKLQTKQVLDKVTLAVHRCKTKGKKLKVKHILDDVEHQKLINLDEGYYIFQTIHNSPAYLEKCKKDAFAMIRQLGFPALFISQSAAETKWPELL